MTITPTPLRQGPAHRRQDDHTVRNLVITLAGTFVIILMVILWMEPGQPLPMPGVVPSAADSPTTYPPTQPPPDPVPTPSAVVTR